MEVVSDPLALPDMIDIIIGDEFGFGIKPANWAGKLQKSVHSLISVTTSEANTK